MIQKRTAIDPGLYESDETAWLEAMSELIKEGHFEDLDFANLAECLADMAKRDRREVESRLTQLIAHVLKWMHQPKKRTRIWHATIVVQRQELSRVLQGGLLRKHALRVLGSVYRDAVEQAAVETGLTTDTFPAECPYALDELLSPDLLGEH
jgi:hypothetical protein